MTLDMLVRSFRDTLYKLTIPRTLPEINDINLRNFIPYCESFSESEIQDQRTRNSFIMTTR
jgi:hypothetical protein